MRFQGLNREFVDNLDGCRDTHGAEGIKKREVGAYGILRNISACSITGAYCKRRKGWFWASGQAK